MVELRIIRIDAKKIFNILSLVLISGCTSQTMDCTNIIMEKYENGNPKIIIQYLSDTANLKDNHYYESYYKNGKLKFRGLVSNGVRKGEWTWWSNSGDILNTKQYPNMMSEEKTIP